MGGFSFQGLLGIGNAVLGLGLKIPGLTGIPVITQPGIGGNIARTSFNTAVSFVPVIGPLIGILTSLFGSNPSDPPDPFVDLREISKQLEGGNRWNSPVIQAAARRFEHARSGVVPFSGIADPPDSFPGGQRTGEFRVAEYSSFAARKRLLDATLPCRFGNTAWEVLSRLDVDPIKYGGAFSVGARFNPEFKSQLMGENPGPMTLQGHGGAILRSERNLKPGIRGQGRGHLPGTDFSLPVSGIDDPKFNAFGTNVCPVPRPQEFWQPSNPPAHTGLKNRPFPNYTASGGVLSVPLETTRKWVQDLPHWRGKVWRDSESPWPEPSPPSHSPVSVTPFDRSLVADRFVQTRFGDPLAEAGPPVLDDRAKAGLGLLLLILLAGKSR